MRLANRVHAGRAGLRSAYQKKKAAASHIGMLKRHAHDEPADRQRFRIAENLARRSAPRHSR